MHASAIDVALELARMIKAPPPLDELGADTMLAVAAVPGEVPEEWQPAGSGAWIAWPHAIGAVSYAEEMTAAQLRALLAARDRP